MVSLCSPAGAIAAPSFPAGLFCLVPKPPEITLKMFLDRRMGVDGDGDRGVRGCKMENVAAVSGKPMRVQQYL